jgi:hypothetical protein
MKLYPMHAMGIRAYCSHLIVDPDEENMVYFLSVAGYQVAVKGIMANLLEYNGVSIETEGGEYSLTRGHFGYKAQARKLPSGLVHAVLFSKLALPGNGEERQDEFFVMAEKREDLLTLFFRRLDEKTEIPLHPSWDRWLWKTFKEQQGWMLEAKTLAGSYQGYLFSFSQNELHDLVSEAIRNREPEVVGCMEWKGGKENGERDIA